MNFGTKGCMYNCGDECTGECIKVETKTKMSKEETARKIVEYFNQDEMACGIWDSIMYQQKQKVIELLNQLNQNKDE